MRTLVQLELDCATASLVHKVVATIKTATSISRFMLLAAMASVGFARDNLNFNS